LALYRERITNNDELTENKEVIMLRIILETAAEITSLLAFGSMVAIWALILGPMA
jgi:hypothetical protein